MYRLFSFRDLGVNFMVTARACPLFCVTTLSKDRMEGFCSNFAYIRTSLGSCAESILVTLPFILRSQEGQMYFNLFKKTVKKP